MYIGNIEINGIASLAPMAGVTDAVFRGICSSFGAAYTTSEMVSVKGIVYRDKKTLELLSNFKRNCPFAVQLFGSNPDDFCRATEIILQNKPDMIDINMGCPAPKIVKSGAGSALMNDPKLCGEIVKKLKKVTKVPITVKIRSGFDENNVTAVEVAKHCEFAGADAITVHGRTRSQMYSGKVDLDIIKSVVKAVSIPVIGNGDILCSKDAQHMMDYTGCSMISIGRGALGNPWLFKEINAINGGQVCPVLHKVDILQKLKVADAHLKELVTFKGEERALKEFRKHLSWYLKGNKGIKPVRSEIFKMRKYEDFYAIYKNISDNTSL